MADRRKEVKDSVYGDLLRAANPGFRFLVEVDDIKQGVFTECTLPVIEWEMTEVKEGGLNSHTHQLPGRRKGAKVTLKNGLAKVGLLEWYLKCMGEPPFTRRSVTITLFNSANKPVITWNIAEAFPVKWTGPDLKAGENSIAIQTLELAGGAITIDNEPKKRA